MWRKSMGYAALALLICVNVALAEDVKGKLTKVDPDGKKVTLTVDGKAHEYAVDKDCKMPSHKGKDGKEKTSTLSSLKNMVEKAKSGVEATVVTTKKDDKEVVTEIKDVSYSDQKKKKDKDS